MLSNHPQTGVFHGSAIQNNAQPNTAEHYLSVCAQLYLLRHEPCTPLPYPHLQCAPLPPPTYNVHLSQTNFLVW